MKFILAKSHAALHRTRGPCLGNAARPAVQQKSALHLPVSFDEANFQNVQTSKGRGGLSRVALTRMKQWVFPTLDELRQLATTGRHAELTERLSWHNSVGVVTDALARREVLQEEVLAGVRGREELDPLPRDHCASHSAARGQDQVGTQSERIRVLSPPLPQRSRHILRSSASPKRN